MNTQTNTNEKTQSQSTGFNGRMIRSAIALAFGATLGACEDVPPPAPKTRTQVSATPTPEVTPTPVPPTPVAAPEIKTPDPVATKTEEDTKPVDAFTGARKMLEAGELDKALELASQAVKEMPNRSAAWNTLGRAQLRLGKRKSAIESFEKAVDLNPRNSYAHNNL